MKKEVPSISYPEWQIDKLRELMKFPFAGHGLSEHMQEVARLAAFGYKTREIADKLGMPLNTAASWLREVKDKTGLGMNGLTRDLIKSIEEVLK